MSVRHLAVSSVSVRADGSVRILPPTGATVARVRVGTAGSAPRGAQRVAISAHQVPASVGIVNIYSPPGTRTDSDGGGDWCRRRNRAGAGRTRRRETPDVGRRYPTGCRHG